MNAATALQIATFRRSLTARVTSALVTLAPAVFSVGFVVLARSIDLDGAASQNFAPYAEGAFADAAAALAGQMIAVWTLLGTGFAVAWIVAREWSDGTYGALFALPISRERIAVAKVAVVSGWGAVSVTLATAAIAAGIAAADPTHMDSAVWSQLGRVWIAGLFMVALALPFGAIAAATRGYLGAVAAIIGATAVSQTLASLGAGAWTPYVAPALWAGAAGADSAADVGTAHLAAAAAFAAIGGYVLVLVFGRSRLD